MYQKGDMEQGRRDLALTRWLTNLTTSPVVVLRPAVESGLGRVIGMEEGHSTKRCIVIPHVDRLPTAGDSGIISQPMTSNVIGRKPITTAQPVPSGSNGKASQPLTFVRVARHDNKGDKTRTLKTRRCDFCFKPYEYHDYRSRYCKATCKRDAKYVRDSWANGYAQAFYEQVGDGRIHYEAALYDTR